jgi:DNA primase
MGLIFLIFMIVFFQTDSIWIHCRQAESTATSHCGQGMVFAINPGPDGNESFATFKAAAQAVGAKLASSAANAPSKSTGSVSNGLSTSTPTSHPNGAISLNIGAAMLMAAFGTVVSLMA